MRIEVKRTFAALALLAALAGTTLVTPAAAAIEPSIDMLLARGMTFRQFAAMLSRGTGQKIVVGAAAGDIAVNLYLENVGVEAALEAACRAYQCWYNRDPVTGIICVITLEEYKKGLSMQDDEIVASIKLRHIDARTVGDSLHRLYRDRVIWERPDDEDDDGIEDLEQALERMDTIADRGQFSQDSQNSGGYGSGSSRYGNDYNRSGRYGSGGRYGRGGNYGSYGRGGNYGRGGSYSGGSDPDLMELEDIEIDVASEALLGQLVGERMDEDGKVQRPGVVFLSVLKSTNTLMIRTADDRAMKAITALLEKLDTPRPQVLLEVKVLELKLDNERKYGLDWLFKSGDFSGGRSPGVPKDISSGTFGDDYGTILPPDANLVPQGTGLDPASALLQVVSDNVVARLQLLEEQGNITGLATPNLCVADSEMSRIFIGTETSILTDVEVNSATFAGDTVTVDESIDPETERRDVGTTLLITPKIHSDKNVTIRVVQEESQLGEFKEIEYGTGQSFKTQDVETRSVVSTIVAEDGAISAVGGLIREDEVDVRSGIPFLMDLPVIGKLFQSQGKQKVRSELLVLLRPYILCGPDDIEDVTMNMVERLSAHPSARDDIPALGVYDDIEETDISPALEKLQETVQPQETE